MTAMVVAAAFVLSAAFSTGFAQVAGDFSGTFLVSDEIYFDRANDTIEAHGNVEVFFEGMKLTAPSVVYDGISERVSVAGPIVLYDAASGSTTFGDFADLSADMQNFVVAAARHILSDELQVAAGQMERREGRYTDWTPVVASYCKVCETRPTPLWEIRAQRATHDQIARMIYFRHAQFRVAGVPLAYAPYLSMPDPTVERATGFVRASIRSSTATGTTLRLPYFIVTGDHSDLTLTPSITMAGNVNPINTLEARYRQSFAYGDLEINSAISRDNLTRLRDRGYVFANGGFAYPSGWNLSFQLQMASDRQYLQNYNFFNGRTETFRGDVLNYATSTLNSNINVNRIRTDEIIQFNATFLDTLQAPTTTTDHPSRVMAGEYARWFTIRGIPGDFLFNTVAQSDYNEFGPSNARQRDIARSFTGLRWSETWKLGGGLLLDTEAAAFSDNYRFRDDPTLPNGQSSANGLGVVTLRWPIEVTQASGIRHSFEPYIRQLALEGDAMRIPDVDGTIDVFDPNGRFALSRFRRFDPNLDLTLTEIGAAYMAHFTNGWSLGGRIEQDYFWHTKPGQYTGGRLYTGELGYRSSRLSFNASRSFNDDFLAIADRASIGYAWQHASFDAAYTRIGIDPVLSTTSKTNLLSANARIDANDAFTLRANIARDTEATDASFASAGIDFDNGMAWRSSLGANYSIDDGEFDRQDLSIGHEMPWGGDMEFFYNFDREERRIVGLNLDYISECILVESQILRRRSVIDDAASAIELSVSVEFGSFEGRGRGACR
ncbi:LPS assembly protein LptD [Rhodobacterales bacterium LSUCC0031]|nr:LPS assembly protein LptD [Rhodobacterales bacterium LSUCC0031]